MTGLQSLGFELHSTFRRELIHRISVRHALTGDPIAGLGAELIDAPPSWSVATVGDEIVVAAQSASFDPDSPSTVRVTFTDQRTVAYLDLADGPDARSVDLVLAQPEHEITIDSVPLMVEIRLNDRTGDPIESETVTIRSMSGATRPTTEVEPGRYRTDPQVFPPSFHRFNVVTTEVIGDGQINPYRLTTSILIIDPT